MFTPTTLAAPCKINLNLHITGVREDGYHELDTVFLALPAPADSLQISPLPQGSGCVVKCDIPGLRPRDNLVYRAWQLHAQATGQFVDMQVHLQKSIPSGAGLGGGSSDAAAMLSFLDGLAGKKALGQQKLSRLAAGLGADVPFFLMGRAARATGIGDRLSAVDHDLHGTTVLLVCPSVQVSTPWAYARWDEKNPAGAAAGHALTSSAPERKKPLPFSTQHVHNDFEEVVFEKHPELGRIKQSLLIGGARAAAMSGSGASLFGLFRSREDAQRTAGALPKDCRAFIHTL